MSFKILALVMLSIQISVAGGLSDGGGMGVVCRDENNQVTSVELLDLWEARVLYQRNIPSLNASVKEQVYTGIKRLKHSIESSETVLHLPPKCLDEEICNETSDTYYGADAIEKVLQLDTTKFLNPKDTNGILRLRDVQLTLTNDAFEVIKPLECQIEQIVRYKDGYVGKDQILINQDLVDKMDNTNLAALYLHEVFYAMLRNYGEKSSIRVRRAVGAVFSGYEFTSWKNILPKTYYKCAGSYSVVLVYKLNRQQYGRDVYTARAASAFGRITIGTEGESRVLYANSLDEVFDYNDLISSALGDMTGFDFGVEIRLSRNYQNKPVATISNFVGAIQTPLLPEILECKITQKK